MKKYSLFVLLLLLCGCKKAETTVVNLEAGGFNSSGFFLNYEEKCYLVTTYHGVSEGTIRIYYDDDIYFGELYGYDLYNDLALIECPELKIKGLVLADSYKEGETAYQLSNVNIRKKDELAQSCVLAERLLYEGIEYAYEIRVLALKNDYEPGASGSPLVNKNNEVVAMIRMKDEQFTYALDCQSINTVIRSILEGKND